MVLAALGTGFALVSAALFAGFAGEGTGGEGCQGEEGEKRFHDDFQIDFVGFQDVALTKPQVRQGLGIPLGTRVLPFGEGRQGALSRRCRMAGLPEGPGASMQQGAVSQIEGGCPTSGRLQRGMDPRRRAGCRGCPKFGVRPHPRLQNNQDRAGCGSGFRRKLAGKGVRAAGAVGRAGRGRGGFGIGVACRTGFGFRRREGRGIATAAKRRRHEAGREQADEASSHWRSWKSGRVPVFKLFFRQQVRG